MSRRLLRVGLFVLLSSCVSAEAQQMTPLKYLFQGVSFFVNDSKVRLREGPGINFKILAVLSLETVVVPVAASNHFDSTVAESPGFLWYECVLANAKNQRGWIYGKYLSCRLQTKDKTLLIGTLGRNPSECEVLYQVDQGYFKLSNRDVAIPDELALRCVKEANGIASTTTEILGLNELQGDNASFSDSGIVRISGGSEARILTADRIDGPPLDSFYHAYVTIGDYFAIGSKAELVRTPGWILETNANHPCAGDFAFLREYVCSEFQAILGDKVQWNEIKGTDELDSFEVMDSGRPSTVEHYFYSFGGELRGLGISLECFLLKHPDGKKLRTNTYLTARRGKEWVLPASQTTTACIVDGLVNSPDLPSTQIIMQSFFGETGELWLWISNGFVVINVGVIYDGPVDW